MPSTRSCPTSLRVCPRLRRAIAIVERDEIDVASVDVAARVGHALVCDFCLAEGAVGPATPLCAEVCPILISVSVIPGPYCLSGRPRLMPFPTPQRTLMRQSHA